MCGEGRAADHNLYRKRAELRMALRNNTRFQMFESCGESLASRFVIALVPVSLGGRYTSQIPARGRVLRVRTSDKTGTGTHYDKQNNTFTCIEWLFTSMPSWVALQENITLTVHYDPSQLVRTREIRHHAPASCILRERRAVKAHRRLILRWIFGHKVFKEPARQVEKHLQLSRFAPPGVHEDHRRISCEVAQRARNALIQGQ